KPDRGDQRYVGDGGEVGNRAPGVDADVAAGKRSEAFPEELRIDCGTDLAATVQVVHDPPGLLGQVGVRGARIRVWQASPPLAAPGPRKIDEVIAARGRTHVGEG